MATLHRRKSVTLNWDGLGDDEDDDDHFFETRERMSSASPIDLEASSSDEDDGFEDSRMSFSSNISPNKSDRVKPLPVAFAATGSEYDMWMAAPGSITERRKRLLLGMGLDENKELLKITSIALGRAISQKFETDETDFSPSTPTSTSKSSSSPPPHSASSSSVSAQSEEKHHRKTKSRKASIIPFVLGRSRSEGDIELFSMPKSRKEEFIGKISKQRLTRTSSDVTFSHGGARPYQGESRIPVKDKRPGRSTQQQLGSKMTSVKSNWALGAFFLIRNLDTGKEFIVNESSEDGMWNRLSDLQTGKKLTMEEFEQHLGISPMVKELMSRDNVTRSTSDGCGYERKLSSQHSYFSKSLRKSKRTGAALLKNIKGVASGFIGEREREDSQKSSLSTQLPNSEQKSSKNEQWVRVRQSGKSMKELSALHLCQEFQAHEGCIWTIRFSMDGHYMASSGEDKVIHVWEVQEFEVMTRPEDGSLTPTHPSLLGSPDRNGKEEGHDKKKKGKHGSKRGRSTTIPDYVHVPETVFSFSEKPYCSFHGHSDDVLDLSWSRSQVSFFTKSTH